MSQETARGLFFLLFGALGIALSGSMVIGTAGDMGVGYVPRALSIGCMIVGGLILAARVIGRGTGQERASLALLPLSIVTALVVAFAILLPWLGLPVTIVAVVLLAGFSGETFKPTVLVATALALACVSTLLFHSLLKLQIPVWPALKGLF